MGEFRYVSTSFSLWHIYFEHANHVSAVCSGFAKTLDCYSVSPLVKHTDCSLLTSLS